MLIESTIKRQFQYLYSIFKYFLSFSLRTWNTFNTAEDNLITDEFAYCFGVVFEFHWLERHIFEEISHDSLVIYLEGEYESINTHSLDSQSYSKVLIEGTVIFVIIPNLNLSY